MPDGDPDTGPVPRIIGVPTHDDDVVVLLPPTFTSSFPVVAPAVSGSSQPVWFRVVRRDGDPVPAAVVALLDDQGREVDTTKTAADGGGELRAPHGGRFLMIVSADGYQPRAAMLSVDEQPVELALLLPRSAAVSGSVRSAARRSATRGSSSGRTTTSSTSPSPPATATTGSTTSPRAPTSWPPRGAGPCRGAAEPRRGRGRARRPGPRRARWRTLIA